MFSQSLQDTDLPKVSIVIPSRRVDGVNFESTLLGRCLRSIAKTTTYGNFEVVLIVDEMPGIEATQPLTDAFGDSIRIIHWTKPFNFSSKVNEGALHTSGEFLLFLNDDVEVISPDWIQAMVSCVNPEVGLVGAELFFSDGTVQHAGIYLEQGDPKHEKYLEPGDLAIETIASAQINSVWGVTAACALMSRETFFSVGGFSSLLPMNFNDVDLAFKIHSLGKTAVVTSGAKLYHYESQTRHSHVYYYERDVLGRRWGLRN